jgi:trigger factor
MQTTVESTDTHTVKLTIEVPPEQVDKDLDLTYRSIAREIKIPGFRPGKAPKPIIDAQVGREVVLEEFVHQSVPTYFREAVSDEDLAPIGDPEVDVEQLEPGKSFIFTATVEVRPRLELTKEQYEGVKVVKPATEPTEADIDSWIERLQRQFAELEPVERPAQETDLLTVSMATRRRGARRVDPRRISLLGRVGEFGETMDARCSARSPETSSSSTRTSPSVSVRTSPAARRSGCSSRM